MTDYKIWTDGTSETPTVYLHSFSDNGEGVWNTCHLLQCPPFNLVSIQSDTLDDLLTPWPAPGVRNGQREFRGQAEIHLENIINKIIYNIDIKSIINSSYNIIGGYSLAGLFALWAMTKTPVFSKCACVSASFWYPDFLKFIQAHPLTTGTESVYFSLGDQENRTKHPLMRCINETTLAIHQIVQQQNITTLYETNPGNHFTKTDLRMAKAIKWTLEN